MATSGARSSPGGKRQAGRADLKRDGFVPVGWLLRDRKGEFVCEPGDGAKDFEHGAIYVFMTAGRVRYVGQTSKSLLGRLRHLASDTRSKLQAGRPLRGAAVSIHAATAGGNRIEAWATAPSVVTIRGETTHAHEAEEIVLIARYGADWNKRGRNP